ncbi:5-aminolevulic acid synthase [Rhodovulum sp. YEN HP10]|uniref:5-aminolevulic acid synthase n=1 Tax=Rhodovulum sp. HP10 TaxID=3387397 RepID=UPI0039DF81E8
MLRSNGLAKPNANRKMRVATGARPGPALPLGEGPGPVLGAALGPALGLVLGLGAAAAVSAAPVDGKGARKLLFKPEGAEVVVVDLPFLSENDRKTLAVVGAQQPYYGAIAVAPTEGLRSKATLAAANYHDVDAARVAALRGCDAARQPRGEPCVIAAEIRPKGWEPRGLQLSADATEGLGREYGRRGGPRAMAISPSTGRWAVSKGQGAASDALSACAEQSGATDCRIAVEDR